ncbi:MAG: hypothetical protein BMS9Abin28_1836 [Anaerolineae bacterium]|nr:MAG: hypothetical protein BMS9Abin28_1836 [Anaerolineae bacterium]
MKLVAAYMIRISFTPNVRPRCLEQLVKIIQRTTSFPLASRMGFYK